MKRRRILLLLLVSLLVGLILWAGRVMSGGRESVVVKGYKPWKQEVLEASSGIPLRNGDRVKPFSTYAKVLMLEYHGDLQMSFQDEMGVAYRVKPEAFLLDLLLRSHLSRACPVFQVENSDILTALGMETQKASDHYSYERLKPYIKTLFDLATQYEERKAKGEELDLIQTQMLALARNVRNYEALGAYFNFARAGIVLPVHPGSPKGASPQMVSTSAFMATAGEIGRIIAETREKGKELPKHLVPVLQQVLNHANDAQFGPVILNPNKVEREWRTIGQGIMEVFQGVDPDPVSTITTVKGLESLYDGYHQKSETLGSTFQEVSGMLQAQLSEQVRQDLAREVSYNRMNWFFRAIFFCFLPAMIFVILSWLAPMSKFGRFMYVLAALFSTGGLFLTIGGITHRSLIMHRPPVGNLYDTIIFIAAGVVFIALLTELLTRRKLALGIAPFMGFFLLVLSWIYEREEGVDNLEPLIAVLRSNFWLTVHVPTITFGYAAGLAAWLFGSVYLFVRLLGLDQDDPSLRRLLTRMTYGSICFTLLLSLIGTVTGGIWANDSWGRFWGWDPKENGALMIVLWTLFILHARMGGILKEWGIHLAAILTGPIVVFSWWHVNLLGVGLHSYGFSDSKSEAVNVFYFINACLLILGGVTAFFQSRKLKSS